MTIRPPATQSSGTRAALFVALILSLVGGRGVAYASDVDVTRQALVLARALAYDRNLPDRAGATVGIGVLYKTGDHEDSAKKAYESFSALGGVKVGGLPVEITLVEWHDADTLINGIESGGIDALYVCAGLTDQVEAIKQVSRAKRVLTLASQRSYVEAGMTLGVFENAGEPKLAVNLPASKAEGASFSAELLRLAEVIR